MTDSQTFEIAYRDPSTGHPTTLPATRTELLYVAIGLGDQAGRIAYRTAYSAEAKAEYDSLRSTEATVRAMTQSGGETAVALTHSEIKAAHDGMLNYALELAEYTPKGRLTRKTAPHVNAVELFADKLNEVADFR